ncbi:hypothetical protein GGI18_000399 [Coemansia linderi]|uniref:Uncharacterized protein n=1 Tax=Coemansia linderi TaxID=2663919 RepID=A0ACC1KPJ5_9FUNG|nr:hypothetical protein GGI18_000399 [Coemansia linderi]
MPTRRKTVLWLGSPIGNFACDGAVQFIAGISDSALTANDAFIVGMDRQKAPEIIMDAYHDSQGITADVFDEAKYSYVGGSDEETGQRNAFLEALEDTLVKWPSEIAAQVKELCGDSGDLLLQRGERIYIESSQKYSDDEFAMQG